MKTYELTHISDLLKVPAELREKCVNELLYALALSELVLGEGVPSETVWTWKDDKEKSATIFVDGKPFVKLSVEKGA